MQDFLLDENGDLLIRNGDFVIGESEAQHIEDMLICPAGLWPVDVLAGIGIRKYYKGVSNQQTLDQVESDIRLNLKYDDWSPNTVSVSSLNNITVDADKN